MKAIAAGTVALLTTLSVAACGDRSTEEPAQGADRAGESNVMLAEWSGPYGGVPAFDRMDLEALRPALEAGMAMNLDQVDAIAQNPDPATFENTIEALERAGRDLGRVFVYWGVLSSNRSSPEFREIQREMAPRISEFNSRITQNDALFQRIRAVYEGDEMPSLRPDQQRLVQLIYDGFARSGAPVALFV